MFNTPKDIMKYTDEQILDMVTDTDNLVKFSKETRYNLVKFVYSKLNLSLTPDVLLCLLKEDSAKAIISTAGSGKTTSTQNLIAMEKMMRVKKDGTGPIEGNKILCLVYNTHNVKDMINTQKSIVNKLKRVDPSLTIDSDICARTMHSLCKEWDEEYYDESGILGKTLMSGPEKNRIFELYIRSLSKKYDIDYMSLSSQDIIKLYDVVREASDDYDTVETLPQYQEVQAPKEFLVDLFTRVDDKKIKSNKYDFTDLLLMMKNMLKEHKHVRDRIHKYYDYIVVDEFQDLTPVMTEILSLIKHKDVPLTCIGDEDQSIYAFKGADINNLLTFTDRFDGAEILSMVMNRRCPVNILEPAKKVIEHNTLRFNKPIVGNKPGGVFQLQPYNTLDGQMINLMDKLSKLDYDQYRETVVCYRNKKSSLLLADYLEERGIPFTCLSGYMPFSHELYRHVLDAMSVLDRGYDEDVFLNLYKVLPITKAELYRVLGYNPATRKWKTKPGYIHFGDLDFKEYNKNPKFVRDLNQLIDLSKIVDKEYLSVYFAKIFVLLRNNFWLNKMELNKDEDIDSYFTVKVFDFFNVDKHFTKFESEFYRRRQTVKRFSDSGEGIRISTFHKLKGLEFDYVYAIEFDDTIFPNFARIEELVGVSDEAKLDLKECETRLCYVAMTRAKKELCIYYNEQNPSIYINWIKAKTLKTTTEVEFTKFDISNLQQPIKSEVISLEEDNDDTSFILEDFNPSGSTDSSDSVLFDLNFEEDLGEVSEEVVNVAEQVVNVAEPVNLPVTKNINISAMKEELITKSETRLETDKLIKNSYSAPISVDLTDFKISKDVNKVITDKDLEKDTTTSADKFKELKEIVNNKKDDNFLNMILDML